MSFYHKGRNVFTKAIFRALCGKKTDVFNKDSKMEATK